MDPILALKSDFPAHSEQETEFKALRGLTLDRLAERDSTGARHALIDCCDFCLTHATTKFDQELELLDLLCMVLEAETFGTEEDKQALVIRLRETMIEEISEDDLAQECLNEIAAARIPNAQLFRTMISNTHSLAGEIDQSIELCLLVSEQYAKNPEETKAAIETAYAQQEAANGARFANSGIF